VKGIAFTLVIFFCKDSTDLFDHDFFKLESQYRIRFYTYWRVAWRKMMAMFWVVMDCELLLTIAVFAFIIGISLLGEQ